MMKILVIVASIFPKKNLINQVIYGLLPPAIFKGSLLLLPNIKQENEIDEETKGHFALEELNVVKFPEKMSDAAPAPIGVGANWSWCQLELVHNLCTPRPKWH